MAYQIVPEKDKNKLSEALINEAYAMYLQQFVEHCNGAFNNAKSCAIMQHDEFKEFYILKILGRSSEFTRNIARDFQFLSLNYVASIPGN